MRSGLRERLPLQRRAGHGASPWAGAVTVKVPVPPAELQSARSALLERDLKVDGEFRGEAERFGAGHVSDQPQIPKLGSDKK